MWRPLPTALRTSKHFRSIVVVVFAIGIPQAQTAVQYRYVRDEPTRYIDRRQCRKILVFCNRLTCAGNNIQCLVFICAKRLHTLRSNSGADFAVFPSNLALGFSTYHCAN